MITEKEVNGFQAIVAETQEKVWMNGHLLNPSMAYIATPDKDYIWCYLSDMSGELVSMTDIDFSPSHAKGIFNALLTEIMDHKKAKIISPNPAQNVASILSQYLH